MDFSPFLVCAASIGLCVFVLWLVSIPIRDVSIADIWWGPGFSLIAWTAWINTTPQSSRYTMVVVVMTLWGLRLATFMARRNLGHGEDSRYQAMRGNSAHFWWVALFKVFLFQGALQLVVALPIYATALSTVPTTILDYLGCLIALIGVIIEALADHQLKQFKAQPSNQGQVMDQGLWGYSRHPNYFGNAVIWVGMGVMGIAAGGPWWILAGPAIMIFLLLKVSGVAMLESTITERRPAYREYMERVPAFIPWPKK